jgi:hypothetical protein
MTKIDNQTKKCLPVSTMPTTANTKVGDVAKRVGSDYDIELYC